MQCRFTRCVLGAYDATRESGYAAAEYHAASGGGFHSGDAKLGEEEGGAAVGLPGGFEVWICFFKCLSRRFCIGMIGRRFGGLEIGMDGCVDVWILPSIVISVMEFTPDSSVIPALANKIVGSPIAEATSECRRRTYHVKYE